MRLLGGVEKEVRLRKAQEPGLSECMFLSSGSFGIKLQLLSPLLLATSLRDAGYVMNVFILPPDSLLLSELQLLM